MSCAKCGECCRTNNEYAVILFPEDVKRIAAGLAMVAGAFLEKHCVSREVGGVTIYYLRKEGGACRFLENRICAIYRDRPLQCRLAPYSFFSDYSNWSHVPCIEGEARFLEKREDSAASDEALLKTLIDPGYGEL